MELSVGSEIKKMYVEKFDPVDYCDTYFNKIGGYDFFVDGYLQAFRELQKDQSLLKEVDVLEIGCGPIPIYAASAVASGFPANLFLSEFLEQNRAALQRWLNGDEEQLNFDLFFKFLSEKSQISMAQLKKMTRGSVKKLFAIDLTSDIDLSRQYPVVMTNECLEVVTSCRKEYKAILTKVLKLVRPGGTFLMGGTIGMTRYKNKSCGEDFPATNLEEEFLKTCFKASQFTIKKLDVLHDLSNVDCTNTNLSGLFFLVAQPPEHV